MDMCVYKKDFFKESHEVQKAITCAVSSLYERIMMYENQNIAFGRIFNDDRVNIIITPRYRDEFAYLCERIEKEESEMKQNE